MAVTLANLALRVAREPRPRERLRPVPELLLLDLDGTLVDTMPAFADLAAAVIARHFGLLPTNARNLYLQTSGVPFAQQLDAIFGDHPAVAPAAAEYEARKHAICAAARMDADTRAALDELRARGVALVVSSNGMQGHVDRFAAHCRGLFELALGFGGALAKGEPHIALVEERTGVARGAMAFVGDSVRDGELAEASGVRFVGRAGTFSRRELGARFPRAPIVESVAELPALL
jgi:phosphoglycolate phosphatase-like HAD superfamily hydrolase